MIFVPTSEPQTPEWIAWRAAAKKATSLLITAVAAGQDVEIDEKVYKAQKQWMMDLFHGKCAYCESPMEADQTGDVEHFRPKKRVCGDDGKPIQVGASGATHAHKGYYWLAYDWRNLLPSCAKCNRPTTSRAGESQGKWDRFPVKGSFRAEAPGDEANEAPLLLNPMVDDPSRHFVFDDNGIVAGVTDEGRECVRVFRLNREKLPELRRAAFNAVRDTFRLMIQDMARGDATEVSIRRRTLEGYASGAEPFAAIGRFSLAKAREGFERMYGGL